jgi:hypothetical protein
MFNFKNYHRRDLLSRKMTAQPLEDYIGQDLRNNSSHARSLYSLKPARRRSKSYGRASKGRKEKKIWTGFTGFT